MSDMGDSASLARLWIGTHGALFAVLVISAVLLVVALLTLIFYCWCCRRKLDHWQRETKTDKSDGSQIELQGDSLDAGSAATATVRGSGAFEIQLENNNKLHYQPAPDYPEFDAQQRPARNPEPVAIQHVELRLEAAAPADPLWQQHHLQLPEVRANAETEKPMRLLRTLVIPPAETQSSRRSNRGSSVYQSDDNEITIVDSDFSDYEDSRNDGRAGTGKKRGQLVARTGQAAESPWQTLPNGKLSGEAPIRAIDRQGVEYAPAPAESLAVQRARRAENLAELDRTLDVFAWQAGAGAGPPARGRRELNPDRYADEEEIRPVDRSQVLF